MYFNKLALVETMDKTLAAVGSYQFDCPSQGAPENSRGNDPLSICSSVSRDVRTPQSVENTNMHVYT